MNETAPTDLRPRIDVAIDRSVTALFSRQNADGSWNAKVHHDPRTTAIWVITMSYVGALSELDATDAVRNLERWQLPDGGFPSYPGSTVSSVPVTGMVLAAFRCAAVSDDAPAAAHGWAWLNAHGGRAALARLLPDQGDLAGMWCAIGGLVDPNALPDPVAWTAIVPGLIRVMETRVNGGTIMVMLQTSWITRALRGGTPWLLGRAVHAAEAARSRSYMLQWRNPDGNWDGSVTQTGLALCSLVAMGHSVDEPDMADTVGWLLSRTWRDADGLHAQEFTTEAWSTAFVLQSLLAASVRPDDPRVTKALHYLIDSQSKDPVPAIDQPDRDEGSYGWAFESDNPRLTDTDDTAAAVVALVRALDRTGPGPLPAELAGKVEEAARRGLTYLLGMQGKRGGFSTFVAGMADKPPGPMFTRPIVMPSNAWQGLQFFLHPPPELGDPPLEGLTGRILCALGALDFGPVTDEVQQAASFLQWQRAPNGVWWARWLTNYLAATLSILRGLAAVKHPMDAPWVAAAIQWTLDRQNPDGGWGEEPTSYDDPALAGQGPSMAPVTAFAIAALVECGLADHPAVERAVAWLVGRQQSDGMWSPDGWTQVFYPPDDLYVGETEPWARPLEALALYRKARWAPRTLDPLSVLGRPLPNVRRRVDQAPSPTTLQRLRAYADPSADDVVTAIFAHGELAAVHALMGALVRSDDPIPAGMPAEVGAWFQANEALPDWADPDKLARAQGLMAVHGWRVAMALFCASLPQAYAASAGARVLLQTRGMTDHAYRRVLETAQFVFDVADEDSFGPEGRAVRAAQKVRLMHATIRHLILQTGRWDTEAWGVPINQEDLLGTLMTFSCVVIDALRTTGADIDDETCEAWMHLWSVVGHLMGVHPAMLPMPYAPGCTTMARIRTDQWAASDHGHDLATALIKTMEVWTPRVLEGLPYALVTHLSGSHCAELLGLGEAPRLDDLLVEAAEALGHVHPHHATKVDVFDLLSERVEEALVNVQREGKQTAFRIPVALVRPFTDQD